MVDLSPGQKLALHQLREIADRSHGALEILGEPEDAKVSGYIVVRLSLATAEYRQESGLAFRERERLKLRIAPDFPFNSPFLYFDHKRFVGAPHVQWGSYICLFQSTETEYDPSDGLYGYFERVHEWMTAAGSGQLDPDDAPLHPPVAYTTSETTFVVKADTPANLPAGSCWLGRADLKKMREDRFDVVGWTSLDNWGEPDFAQPVAAAVFFDKPLAMEYPSKVNDLINVIEAAGLAFGMFYRVLRLVAVMAAEGEPAHLVLGAPMRRKAAGEPLRPHLTVWEIGPDPLKALRDLIHGEDEEGVATKEVAKWMVLADVRWCRVLEDRPEIVHRRDGGSLLSMLDGKRVLLFGCGALGSAVGEAVVRSGATRIHLVDYGRVKPGILVRQRYTDADIGLAKVEALKAHLVAIGFPCTITAEVGDLSYRALKRFTPDEFDIVIDTAASVGAMRRIEEELKQIEFPVPLLSLSVSAAASHGSLAVRMPGYRGGPHRIFRQAKLEAFARDASNPLVKAFWPERGELKVFQPEPGCSAPTFVGSAADIDFHAAGLLNLGLKRMQSLASDEAGVDLVAGPWVERTGHDAGHLQYTFKSCAPITEQRYRFQVLQSAAAARGMATEMRRNARARSDKIETGGLIFGEIDESHLYIWIDSVTGPPPDSQASAEQFLCGTAGTMALAAYKAKASGGSSRFIGIWHTHPVSRGRPSQDDLVAMVQLLHGQEFPPRQVLMLIVGFAATNPVFNYYLFRREEFQLIPLYEGADGGTA